jgi:hypothetical protein
MKNVERPAACAAHDHAKRTSAGTRAHSRVDVAVAAAGSRSGYCPTARLRVGRTFVRGMGRRVLTAKYKEARTAFWTSDRGALASW